MQADVILKEPPPWVPPSASQGGTNKGGGASPSYAPDSDQCKTNRNNLIVSKCHTGTQVQLSNKIYNDPNQYFSIIYLYIGILGSQTCIQVFQDHIPVYWHSRIIYLYIDILGSQTCMLLFQDHRPVYWYSRICILIFQEMLWNHRNIIRSWPREQKM